jgi:hypothetical protein
MTPRIVIGIITGCGLSFVSAAVAQDALMTLSNNPFSQPAILNAPPPPPARPEVVFPPEEIRLEVNATRVSATMPMSVVDGELLTVGQKIEGFKLIAVKEGEAVFRRAGRNFSFRIEDRESE